MRNTDTPLIERIHQEMRGSRGVLSVRELATRLGVKKHQVRAAVEGDTHFAGAEHAAQFGTARYLIVQDSGQAFVLRPVRGAAEQRSVTASEGAGKGEGQRAGSAKEGGLASDGIVVDRGATAGTATAGKPGDPRPTLWERIAGMQSKLSDARAAQVEQRAAASALHTERADLVTELVGRRAAELLKRPAGGEPALPGPTELPSLDFGAGGAGAKAGAGVTVRVLGEARKQAPDARAAEIGERIAEIDTQLGVRAAAEQAAATQEGELTGHLAEAEVLARRLTQYIDGNPGAGPASLASIGLGRHDLPTSFDEVGRAENGSGHWAPENNRPRVEQQRPELRAPADTAAPTRSNTADRQTRVWFTKVLIPASLVLARIIAPHPATIPAELAMLHGEPTISTRTSLGGDPAAGGKIVIVEQAKAPPSVGAEPEVTRSSEAPGSGSGGPSDTGLADQPIWLWRDRLISAATLNPDEELGGTPHLDAFGRTESAAQRLPAPGIDAVTWAQYSPAQRAEAWDRHADSVRDAAQAAEQRIQQLRGAAAGHKDLTRSVTQQIEQLRTEQRRLTAQLRQLTRVTTVLRAQLTLPRRKLSQTQRHWRPELGGQRAAERAARHLAELGQRNADLQRGIAELTQSRTQQQRWRGASTQRLREARRDHGRDWIRAHYQHASAARQWAALHRDVAAKTRGGRRQLAEIELYRAAGTSAAEQVERAVSQKMLRRLAARGVPERALAKLASLAEQGADGRRVLSAVLAAGLGSDDAAIRTLARLARDNRLGWSPETRRAVLAALPRTMAAWSRVISPPRNAAWQYQQRRARQLATAGTLVGGVGLLGGTLAMVGLPSTAILLVAGVGAVVLNVVLPRLFANSDRVRGPPVWLRVTLSLPSAALILGALALTGAGPATLVVSSVGMLLGSLAKARLLRPGTESRSTRSGLAKMVLVGGTVATLAVTLFSGVGMAATLDQAPAGRVAVATAPISSGSAGQLGLGQGSPAAGRPARVEVREFNTLTGLARALGVSVDDLVRANPHLFPTLASRHWIYPGQLLNIPTGWEGTWTLQRGESFWTVNAQLHPAGGLPALQAANRHQMIDGNPNLLPDGARLTVPGNPAGPPSRPGTPPGPTKPGPQPGTPTPSPSSPPTGSHSPAPSTHPSTPPTATPTPSIRGPPASGLDWGLLAEAGTAVLAVVATVLGARLASRHLGNISRRLAPVGDRLGEITQAVLGWPKTAWHAVRDRSTTHWQQARDRLSAKRTALGDWLGAKRIAAGTWLGAKRTTIATRLGAKRTAVTDWLAAKRRAAKDTLHNARVAVGNWLHALPGKAARAGTAARHGIAKRLHIDVPVSESGRRVGTATAGALVGWGGALAILSHGLAGPQLGLVLIGAGAVAFVRAVWTPAQARAPPLAALKSAWRSGAVRRTAASVALGAAAGVLGPFAGGLLLQVLDQPGLTTFKSLLSTAISGVMTFRYVLRRQLRNQERGMQTDPRRSAWRSAWLAVAVTGGYRLLVAVAPAGWWSPLLGPLTVGAAVVAVISSGVQSKDMGRTRLLKALIAGPVAIGAAYLAPKLGVGLFGSLGDWWSVILGSAVAVAANTPIADYLVARAGRTMAKKSRPNPVGKVRLVLRKLLRIGLPNQRLESFSRVDSRLLFWKALDPVFSALFSALLTHAWWGWTDTPPVLAGRVAAIGLAVWGTNRLRDWVEHRLGYDGYVSERTLRAPERASLLRGPRLGQQVGGYRDALAAALASAGVPVDPATADKHGLPPLTDALADDLAAKLAELLDTPILPATQWWDELVADNPGLIARDVLDNYRAAAAQRRDQHQVAVAHALQVLALDPARLRRLAVTLEAKKPETAKLVRFAVRLVTALAANPTMLALTGVADPAVSSPQEWIAALREEIKERNRLRENFLVGPTTDVLEAILTHYAAVDPHNANFAKTLDELGQLEIDAVYEAQRKPERDPLGAATELFNQRRRSAAETNLPELAASMALSEATGRLFGELTLSRPGRADQRGGWDTAIAQALPSTPTRVPSAPLDLLLTVAGRRGPVTAAALAAQFGRTPDDWAATLADWADAGPLAAGPDGYRPTDTLRTAWRNAGPRLRRAARADMAALPGGDAVVDALSRGDLAAAHRALVELLNAGALARRYWHDGWVDDAGILLRGVVGGGYRVVHPDSRANWRPGDHQPGPVDQLRQRMRDGRRASQERAYTVKAQRQALREPIRRVNAATQAYYRLRMPGHPQNEEWRTQLRAARQEQIDAYAALARALAEARAALRAADVYPPQVDKTLSPATTALAPAPGVDTPQGALEQLLAARAELRTALRALKNNPHRGGAMSDGRRNALLSARLALESHEWAREHAIAVKLFRTSGGWNALVKARQAADEVRKEARELAMPLPRPLGPIGNVIPDAAGDGQLTVPGAAALTMRGRGNQVNQDAAALPSAAIAVLADGLGAAANSELASRTAARIMADRLAHTPAGTDPIEALRAAYQAAAEEIAANPAWAADSANWAPSAGRFTNPPATTVLAARVISTGPGSSTVIALGWVGDTRAYWLPAGGTPRLLTVDHAEAGMMTGWLAPDNRPDLRTDTVTMTGPGLLVLGTDGLWNHLPQAADLAKAVGDAYADPTEAATRLARTARNAGAADDLTVAVLAVPGTTAPGAATPSGLTTPGPTTPGPTTPGPTTPGPTTPGPATAGPAQLAGLGPELSERERGELADQLEAVLAQLPSGFDRQALLIDIWLVDAATQLRGQGWDPAWPRPPPLVLHRPTTSTVWPGPPVRRR